MGRYYSGDINGKFWFGTQSSGDASYFGAEFTYYEVYKACGCAENGTPYCTDCYSSYEEHVEDAEIEEGDSLVCDESSDMRCIITDIDVVREKVEELESQVGYAIKSYTIDKKNYTYDLSIEEWETINADRKDPSQESLRILVARLCLGKQILAWMEDHPDDDCNFDAEL